MNGTAKELVQKLRTIRDEMSHQPWVERREALRRCLEHELGRIPRGEAVGTFAAIRQELRSGDGGDADESDLRTELKGLQAECDRLRAERDRVKNELAEARRAADETQRLAEENDKLRQSLSRLRDTKRAPAMGDGAAALRDGFVRCLDGATAPDPAEFGLAGEGAAMFRSVCEVLNFARNYDLGLNSLILDISGKLDSHGTTMAVMTRKIFRKRFVESLDGSDETQDRLKETLKSNLKFLLMLNDAYLSCLRPGARALLGEIDPQAILAKHKRFMHFDFDRAFKALQRDHTDLTNLTRDELWETYFSKTVRRKLGDYLDDLDEL